MAAQTASASVPAMAFFSQTLRPMMSLACSKAPRRCRSCSAAVCNRRGDRVVIMPGLFSRHGG